MSEEFQWNEDYQAELLANRFEEMIHNGDQLYFDAEEFETLIDYYQNSLNSIKSRIAVDMAMQQHPYSSGLRIKLARQLATEGKFIDALEILNEIELAEPSDPDLHMTKGSVYSMMMDFEKAIRSYKAALFLVGEEEMEDIYATIAFEYENMSDFTHALVYLKKALQISKQPDQVLFEIGMCFEMLNDLDQATAFFETYINENPYSVSAWFNLGLAFHHLGLFEKAIDSFEYALAIDDTYVQAYNSIGQSYVALERYEKAIESYKETMKYEKAGALTYYNIGECYEKLSDYDNALKLYYQAVELDENLAEPWAGIGVIFDEEGKTKTAVKYIKKAIELDPYNTEFLLIQADMHIKLKEYNNAAICFRKIEELDPLDPDLWVEYADLYIVKKDYEKATQILKTGLIHQSENSRILYRLAAVLFRQGNEIQGQYYLENALELDFDGHAEMIEFYPAVIENDRVADLIQIYKLNQLRF